MAVDLPQENPLFNDPSEPQSQICGELLMAQQRMLCDYALPIVDVVRGSIERLTINANKFEIKTVTIQIIQNTT